MRCVHHGKSRGKRKTHKVCKKHVNFTKSGVNLGRMGTPKIYFKMCWFFCLIQSRILDYQSKMTCGIWKNFHFHVASGPQKGCLPAVNKTLLFQLHNSKVKASTLCLRQLKKPSTSTGHILRKVYNCRKMKDFWPLLLKIFSHLLKISDNFFLVIDQEISYDLFLVIS